MDFHGPTLTTKQPYRLPRLLSFRPARDLASIDRDGARRVLLPTKTAHRLTNTPCLILESVAALNFQNFVERDRGDLADMIFQHSIQRFTIRISRQSLRLFFSRRLQLRR
jgi:hypothetical protein